MKREKALEAMDTLNAAGYTVAVWAMPQDDRWVNLQADEDGRTYNISIQELGLDKLDLKALVGIADKLDLEVSISALTRGHDLITFTDYPLRPHVPAVDGPRKHPR